MGDDIVSTAELVELEGEFATSQDGQSRTGKLSMKVTEDLKIQVVCLAQKYVLEFGEKEMTILEWTEVPKKINSTYFKLNFKGVKIKIEASAETKEAAEGFTMNFRNRTGRTKVVEALCGLQGIFRCLIFKEAESGHFTHQHLLHVFQHGTNVHAGRERVYCKEVWERAFDSAFRPPEEPNPEPQNNVEQTKEASRELIAAEKAYPIQAEGLTASQARRIIAADRFSGLNAGCFSRLDGVSSKQVVMVRWNGQGNDMLLSYLLRVNVPIPRCSRPVRFQVEKTPTHTNDSTGTAGVNGRTNRNNNKSSVVYRAGSFDSQTIKLTNVTGRVQANGGNQNNQRQNVVRASQQAGGGGPAPQDPEIVICIQSPTAPTSEIVVLPDFGKPGVDKSYMDKLRKQYLSRKDTIILVDRQIDSWSDTDGQMETLIKPYDEDLSRTAVVSSSRTEQQKVKMKGAFYFEGKNDPSAAQQFFAGAKRFFVDLNSDPTRGLAVFPSDPFQVPGFIARANESCSSSNLGVNQKDMLGFESLHSYLFGWTEKLGFEAKSKLVKYLQELQKQVDDMSKTLNGLESMETGVGALLEQLVKNFCQGVEKLSHGQCIPKKGSLWKLKDEHAHMISIVKQLGISIDEEWKRFEDVSNRLRCDNLFTFGSQQTFGDIIAVQGTKHNLDRDLLGLQSSKRLVLLLQNWLRRLQIGRINTYHTLLELSRLYAEPGSPSWAHVESSPLSVAELAASSLLRLVFTPVLSYVSTRHIAQLYEIGHTHVWQKEASSPSEAAMYHHIFPELKEQIIREYKEFLVQLHRRNMDVAQYAMFGRSREFGMTLPGTHRAKLLKFQLQRVENVGTNHHMVQDSIGDSEAARAAVDYFNELIKAVTRDGIPEELDRFYAAQLQTSFSPAKLSKGARETAHCNKLETHMKAWLQEMLQKDQDYQDLCKGRSPALKSFTAAIRQLKQQIESIGVNPQNTAK